MQVLRHALGNTIALVRTEHVEAARGFATQNVASPGQGNCNDRHTWYMCVCDGEKILCRCLGTCEMKRSLRRGPVIVIGIIMGQRGVRMFLETPLPSQS